MDLLERFAQGELEAFETLFRQFQGAVYGWSVRIVRAPGIAEDLTVETFWRIYRAHARFDPRGSFGAWARRIATHLALGHLRSARREVELPAALPEKETPNPALQRELREKIQDAFRQLPAKLQLAATLALIEERSHREIAEALGTTAGAVKLRVFRAVRQLRKRLKRAGVEA